MKTQDFKINDIEVKVAYPKKGSKFTGRTYLSISEPSMEMSKIVILVDDEIEQLRNILNNIKLD